MFLLPRLFEIPVRVRLGGSSDPPKSRSAAKTTRTSTSFSEGKKKARLESSKSPSRLRPKFSSIDAASSGSAALPSSAQSS